MSPRGIEDSELPTPHGMVLTDCDVLRGKISKSGLYGESRSQDRLLPLVVKQIYRIRLAATEESDPKDREVLSDQYRYWRSVQYVLSGEIDDERSIPDYVQKGRATPDVPDPQGIADGAIDSAFGADGLKNRVINGFELRERSEKSMRFMNCRLIDSLFSSCEFETASMRETSLIGVSFDEVSMGVMDCDGSLVYRGSWKVSGRSSVVSFASAAIKAMTLGASAEEWHVSRLVFDQADLATDSDLKEEDRNVTVQRTVEESGLEYDSGGRVKLVGVVAGTSSFVGADLRGARLENCSLVGADFSESLLEGAVFEKCNLEKAKWDGCTGIDLKKTFVGCSGLTP